MRIGISGRNNFLIFTCSDLWASFARIYFEARKQLIQMWNKNIEMRQIARGWYLGITPLILRDYMFRSTLLGVYYSTTDIEHKPILKYSMSEMIDYVKHWRENGEPDATLKNKTHLFIDYHNYKINTQMQTRFLLMLFANAIATLITNPIDVCLTKILTQQERKYTGLLNCMTTVLKEEGAGKLLSGIHPRFMFNSINGIIFLYIYEQLVGKFYEVYRDDGQ